jgi:hypothetical protein
MICMDMADRLSTKQKTFWGKTGRKCQYTYGPLLAWKEKNIIKILYINAWKFVSFQHLAAVNSLTSARRLESPRRPLVPTIPPCRLSASTHHNCRPFLHPKTHKAPCCVRLQLKCDGTRWRREGTRKGNLANAVGSQYPSHYLGTWCIQHY